uniref:Uncharacterized protein n=1 Tax=Mucochytrium quahogii TaxID=96639 RepID=A0A7S2WCF0_9STRA
MQLGILLIHHRQRQVSPRAQRQYRTRTDPILQRPLIRPDQVHKNYVKRKHKQGDRQEKTIQHPLLLCSFASRSNTALRQNFSNSARIHDATQSPTQPTFQNCFCSQFAALAPNPLLELFSHSYLDSLLLFLPKRFFVLSLQASLAPNPLLQLFSH